MRRFWQQSNAQILKKLFLIFLSISILFGMIWKIGFIKVYETLMTVNFQFILLSFMIFFIVAVVKLIRWSLLFKKVNFIGSCKLYILGQAMNETAPAGSGELTRAYLAKDRYKIHFGETLACATIERIADTSFLIILSIIGFLFIADPGFGYQILIPLTIIVLFYFVAMKPELLDFFIMRLNVTNNTENLLGKFFEHIGAFLGSFKASLFEFHNRKLIILITFFFTVLAWGSESIGHKIVLLSLGYDISILKIISIAAISWMIGIFSFLPGGLGTRDAVFSILLNIQGIPIEVSMSAALIYRAVTYLILGVGSVLVLFSWRAKGE